MKLKKSLSLSPLLLAGLLCGCSGMGTTMTKVGRMGQNQGYEIAADQSVVQLAAIAVLKAHGYETSVKPDPESGAENAGQIVIGQKVVKYNAADASATAAAAPKQIAIRDLADVYLSKKWQLSSNQAAPRITLVNIVGGTYVSTAPGGDEKQTPLTKEYISMLRDEIERGAGNAAPAGSVTP